MPKDKLFTAAVCRAAAHCFAAGDSIRGVASTLQTDDRRVRRILERGRKPGAPAYLANLADAYDGHEPQIERNRAALGKAAGLDYGGDDV